MRLIATMGATKTKNEQKYIFKAKEYKAKYSFLALAKALKIDDIVIIGTSKTKETLQDLLNHNPKITMEVIDSENVEDVFQKSLEYITKNTILDLTQGFRHYPMLLLLATLFVQNDKSKNVKNIYYAQAIDFQCNPIKERCNYRFVSLYRYIDISNMARIIETFVHTLLTLDYEVHDEEFIKLKNEIKKLTKTIFSNNYEMSKDLARDIKNKAQKLLEQNNLDIIRSHLHLLIEEMQIIETLKQKKESQTLLKVAEYFKNKDLLLHSVTTLFEAMVAFLDENINLKKCNEKRKYYTAIKANTYERRNCLKRSIYKCRSEIFNKKIPNCKEFSNRLENIDRLRNISAHAHTTDSFRQDLKEEITDTITFLKPIFDLKDRDGREIL